MRGEKYKSKIPINYHIWASLLSLTLKRQAQQPKIAKWNQM